LSIEPKARHHANGTNMKKLNKRTFSKVPAVTLAFWIVKIMATTLGETGGDAVSMSMNLGYLVVGVVVIRVVRLSSQLAGSCIRAIVNADGASEAVISNCVG